MTGRADAIRMGSAGVWDGKTPVVSFFGRTQWAAAAQLVAGFVAPCDLTLERASLFVPVMGTHAGCTLALGKSVAGTIDDDNMIDDYVLQNIAAGAYNIDLVNDVLVLSRTVLRGEIVYATMRAADTTGSLSGTFVWRPTY